MKEVDFFKGDLIMENKVYYYNKVLDFNFASKFQVLIKNKSVKHFNYKNTGLKPITINEMIL